MSRTLILSFGLLFSAPVLADDDDDDGVRPADLPAEVIAAVATQAPGAEILSAEREHGSYEVRVRGADGATREIEITPASAQTPARVHEDDDKDGKKGDDDDKDEDER